MDGLKTKISALACVLSLVAACASDPSLDRNGSDEFSQLDSAPGKEGAAPKEDAFADFDNDKSIPPAANEDERLDSEVAQASPKETPASKDDELDAPDAASSPTQEASKSPEPPVADSSSSENLAVAPPVAVDNSQSPPDAAPDASAAAAPPATPPESPAEAPSAPVASQKVVTIQNMGVRSPAGDTPTLEISANGPIEYKESENTDLNQMVIDIPNSKLAARAKLPLNMRDFPGAIASVTAYRVDAHNTRIVVQLRPGATPPAIEPSGNKLLVRTGGDSSATQVADSAAPPTDQHSIMTSSSLEDFLANNQKFYGKEISIETDDTELTDVFKLISDEAHVNLVVTDEVKGKISVKLKNTPWDQALVIIMKSKKLGYSRSGNILRIAPVADLKKEEEDSLALATAHKSNGNLIAKSIQVNYAKIDDIEKQIKTVLSPRGTVVSDARTASVIVTDIDENLARAIQLVQTLDIPPQQVLIEGKIVEAQDTFERDVGFTWGLSGRTSQLSGASSSSGPIRFSQAIGVTPGAPTNPSFGLNFNIGTFDVIGDLTAALQLYEQKGTVKVLSSPRILALHNEKSQIGQDMQIPLITSSTAAAGATAVPTVTYKDVRLNLEVTPLITNEGTVIMDVTFLREFPGAIADITTQARPVNSRSTKTKVLVRNGQTAVIGGIYENNITDSETRVPGLASIPIVGWLFKSKNKTATHEELLIFLTPKILASAQAQPGVMNSSNSPDTAADPDQSSF